MKFIKGGLLALIITASLSGAALRSEAQTASKKGAHAKTAGAVQYKAHCGMIYSAADAKKNHYICPMDHKPLVKMVAGKSNPAGKMKMSK